MMSSPASVIAPDDARALVVLWMTRIPSSISIRPVHESVLSEQDIDAPKGRVRAKKTAADLGRLTRGSAGRPESEAALVGGAHRAGPLRALVDDDEGRHAL